MRFNLKQQQFYGTLPFSYSKHEDWLVPAEKNKLQFEKLKSIFYGLLCVGLWAQLLFDDKRTERVIWLESLYYVSAHSIILFSKQFAKQSSPQMMELYNIFVNYEKNYLNGKFSNTLN